MPLPWVKLTVDALDTPQAEALAHRLDDPRAGFYPVGLTLHTARFYPAGSLPDSEEAGRSLEAACRWPGEPGALVAALLAAGYLRRRRRRLEVVGWREAQAAHVEKLDRDRTRMRAKRAEEREKRRGTVARRSQDGRATEERRGRGEETRLQAEKGSQGSGAASPPPEPLPLDRKAWDADVASQTADLNREEAAEAGAKAAARKARRNGAGVSVSEADVLGALPGTVCDLAARLGLPADGPKARGVLAVGAALQALRGRGIVRTVERGAPPVKTWERVEAQRS